jgi:hypothetical protein
VQIVSVQYGGALPDDQTRRPDRSHAVVNVRYRIGGAVHDGRVSVQRSGLGLFRDWEIDSPPGALLDVVSPNTDRAQLAGAAVPTVKQAGTGANTSGAVWALPGTYTLTAAPNPLFDVTPVTVIVAGGDRQQAEPPVTLKPAVLAAVDRQVHDRIDACAKQDNMQPDVDPGALGGGSCPMRYNTSYTFTRQIKWTIDRYPALEIRIGDDGPQVHTTTAGKATINYQWTTGILEPRTWHTETDTTEITVSGPVELVDGKPTWKG